MQAKTRRLNPSFNPTHLIKNTSINRGLGFTLIELLMSLALISLITTLAAPNFAPMIESYHSRHAQYAVVQAFKDARADAVSNGVPVIICGSSDGVHCDKAWGSLLMLFRDSNGDEEFNMGDALLYQKRLLPNGGSLTTYRRYFRVRPMGNLASHPDSFRYCSYGDKEHNNWRAVVNRLGRVRIDNKENNGASVRCPT